MNYGKYFRLNQNISKIEEGVAIFDYIDLPAYFESSGDNLMSPKYPISVTLTEDSILFRVHYSTYKTNESYIYDVKRAYSDKSSGTILNHMEEIILKLPYANDSIDDLSNIIHDIYNTRYPLLIGGKTTFIKELIIKRYGYGIESSQDSSTAQKLYDKLRENLDKDLSYSTLWLMDIVKNESVEGNVENKNIYLFDKDGQTVVKFLRKLLLDFMFDLQHSDVFQTSKYYQLMYSGLMSNFYFSALMHKCEYYYYRDLTEQAIMQFEESKKKGCNVELDEKRIVYLYAEELFKAEKLWIQDIMNPMADTYFNHLYFGKDEDSSPQRSNFLSFIWNSIKNELSRYKYRRWDSWFAEPEEEMRRVCFTMKEIEKDGTVKRHICNAETLSEYLELGKKKENLKNCDAEREKFSIITKMIFRKDNNRVAISQWFLKRYAVNDVLHLHLFNYATRPFFLTLTLLLICVFIFPRFIGKDFWLEDNSIIHVIIAVLYCLFCIIFAYNKYKKEYKRSEERASEDSLYNERCKMVKKRNLAILSSLLVFLGLIILPMIYVYPYLKLILDEGCALGTLIKLVFIFFQILFIILAIYWINKKISQIHWLSNMHVFYPRLIASIAAAWLTIAIGNELFGTFFDSMVSWSTSVWLAVMVFIFVMYEINKMLPLETVLNKTLRCLSIMSISYMISLVVGLFIVNFTGERFLERSGVLEDFYAQYVEPGHERQVEHTKYKFTSPKSHKEETSLKSSGTITIVGESKLKDSLTRDVTATGDFTGQVYYNENDNPVTDAERLKDLEEVYINTNGEDNWNHPIVTTWELGDAKFFILRDFLIQFAFVAMFIGIFIQMIFEEKNITEM